MGLIPARAGNTAEQQEPEPVPGLIPARAGNTISFKSLPLIFWAHPRSRGEHSTQHLLSKMPTGSSPLARGTRYRCTGYEGFVGLIPARAGNTLPRRVENPRRRAHPRSRGEHVPQAKAGEVSGGSSPLARGTRFSPRK